MLYTILTAAAVILLLPILLKMFTDLDAKQRMGVYVAVGVIVGLISVFQYIKTGEEELKQQTIVAFEQGESVYCGSQRVGKDSFLFVSGTMTFSAKPDSDFRGQVYRVQECRVKE